MSSTTIEHCLKYTDPGRDELNLCLNFHHLKVDYPGEKSWSLATLTVELKRILMEWQVAADEGGVGMPFSGVTMTSPVLYPGFGSDENEENVFSAGR